MLTTSSCVFVPVDDPTKDLLDNIAEVEYLNKRRYTISSGS